MKTSNHNKLLKLTFKQNRVSKINSSRLNFTNWFRNTLNFTNQVYKLAFYIIHARIVQKTASNGFQDPLGQILH